MQEDIHQITQVITSIQENITGLCLFYSGYAYVFIVNNDGRIFGSNVDWTDPGVPPVINLKANVTISSGDGTAFNPYVI